MFYWVCKYKPLESIIFYLYFQQYVIFFQAQNIKVNSYLIPSLNQKKIRPNILRVLFIKYLSFFLLSLYKNI